LIFLINGNLEQRKYYRRLGGGIYAVLYHKAAVLMITMLGAVDDVGGVRVVRGEMRGGVGNGFGEGFGGRRVLN